MLTRIVRVSVTRAVPVVAIFAAIGAFPTFGATPYVAEAHGSAAEPIPQATKFAAGETPIGFGFSDSSPHQVVRSSANRLYVSVPSCEDYPNCSGNVLAMYAARQPGIAHQFDELDAAHRPRARGQRDSIGSSALAIDGSGRIDVAYITRNEGAYFTTFDVPSGRWGRAERLGRTDSGLTTQGREGIALAVDAAGNPHVAWTFLASQTKHIAYAWRSSGGWSHSSQIDDSRLGPGQGALHPTLAFAPNGTLLASWLVGNERAAYNFPDGRIAVRTRNPGGSWSPSVEIPERIAPPNPGYAATTIDQGPSLLVTADGVAHLTFIDVEDAIRYWYSPDYRIWHGARQPNRQLTHDPVLGPDGNGGIFIYGHGTPAGDKNGHGNSLYRMQLAAGATAWSPFNRIVSDPNVDCSVSTRWSQFFHFFPKQIDYTYWNDHKPDFQILGQF